MCLHSILDFNGICWLITSNSQPKMGQMCMDGNIEECYFTDNSIPFLQCSDKQVSLDVTNPAPRFLTSSAVCAMYVCLFYVYAV